MTFEHLASKLTLDATDYNRSIENAESSTESFGDRAASLGGKMQSMGTKLSVGVTGPIAAMGAASIKTASEVEEMEAKTEAVFGDLTDEVRDWAETTADEMGRSRFALEETASGFQDLLVPMGATRQEGMEMSQQLTELTQDLSSFNNVPAEQVQQNLQSALTGSAEAMRKYGVDVSAAAVEQELLNMGIEGGREEASRMEKAQARMNIIMEETADAQGNAAETSDSFANQMRALKADTEEFRAEIGQHLLPAASGLIDHARGLVSWFGELDDSQQKVILAVAGVVAVVGPLLAVFGTFLAMVPAIIAGATAIGGALTLMTGPIGIAIAAIGALAAAWATDFMGIKGHTEDGVNFILGMLDALVEKINKIPGVDVDFDAEDVDFTGEDAPATPEEAEVAGEEAGMGFGQQFNAGALDEMATDLEDAPEKAVEEAGMADAAAPLAGAMASGDRQEDELRQIQEEMRARHEAGGDPRTVADELASTDRPSRPSSDTASRATSSARDLAAAVREALAGLTLDVDGEFDAERGIVEIVDARLSRQHQQAKNRGAI